MDFYKRTPLLKQLYQTYKLATSNRYTIGFMEFSEDLVKQSGNIPEVHWIKDGYKEGWFADPFILRMTEQEIIVLVEEFVYKLKRGVISQVIINKSDYSIKEVKRIINTGYHLSFPSYYRKGGKVYIYPEQGARGATWLYEYDEKTCEAKELNIINPNDTVDTTILELPDGKKYLTCTTAPYYNGSKLDIYPYFEKDCPSLLKPCMQIDSPHKTARNAGLFFKVGDVLYRPAQYCEKEYGEATEIQKLIYDGNGISFMPVRRIYSPSKIYPDAFHTFNVYENKWVVVDARRRRFPIIAKMIGKN
jgi:hypothetical protein